MHTANVGMWPGSSASQFPQSPLTSVASNTDAGLRASFPCSDQSQTHTLIPCPSQAWLLTFKGSSIPGLSCPLDCYGWLCLGRSWGRGVQGDSLRKNRNTKHKGEGWGSQQPLPAFSTAPCPYASTGWQGFLFVYSVSQQHWGSRKPSTLLSGIPFQKVLPPDLSRVPLQLSLSYSEIPKCLKTYQRQRHWPESRL